MSREEDEELLSRKQIALLPHIDFFNFKSRLVLADRVLGEWYWQIFKQDVVLEDLCGLLPMTILCES
jgi:hypothetical protein